MICRSRVDDNVAGSDGGQAGGGEIDGDGFRDVVGEIAEGGHAVDGRGGERALQSAGACAASRRDDSTVVGGDQVAKGILDPNDRLWRKGNSGRRGGRRLSLDHQFVGSRGIDHNPRLRAGDGTGHRVGGRDRLSADGLQR